MKNQERWRDAVFAKLQHEHFTQYFDAYPNDRIRHTLQITSFGGSGTTAFADHLTVAGADTPKTPGQFPYKHLPEPPAADEVPAGFRTVYLYGDPRDAVLSLFRRNYQYGHFAAMHLREAEGDAAGRLETLESFLDAGIDDFGIERHVTNWLERAERPYPVLALRFEDSARCWPEVRAFAGLDQSVPALSISPRHSNWGLLPEPQRARLDAMYGPVAARLAALAPLEMR